jgi:hypothetical protein
MSAFFAGLLLVWIGSAISLDAAEPTHAKAYTITPTFENKTLKIESFVVGTRGLLWLGCRMKGDAGQPDSGRMIVYEPNGLLFDSFPVSFIPEAITFSPRSSLYVASADRVLRVALSGAIEAEYSVPRLFDNHDQAAFALLGRPAIAATDANVFVAYPASSDRKYAVWRLSPDLSVEVKIVEGLENCRNQLPMRTDGQSLVIAESTRGQIAVFTSTGKRVKVFGKKADGDAGFSGDCNLIAIRAIADNQVLTLELRDGAMKRINHAGELVALVAKQSQGQSENIDVDWDSDRNWFYLMNSADSSISVFHPIED